MTKERRLGRGLEALLGRPADDTAPYSDARRPEATAAAPADAPVKLSVYEIDSNPYQPRTYFDEDEIAGLSDDIKKHGLLHPLVVRRVGERFQLISGERRWRAVIRAGWSEVTAVVRDADDREVAELTLVENLQRKDLGPLEKAVSFQHYLAQYQCTQEELAQRLSKDRSTIANLIRLLELPEVVQQAISEQKITAGHARALLPLGEEREQVDFCQRIQQEHLSVRATEQAVSETIRAEDATPLSIVGDGPPGRKSTPRADHLAALEQEFRRGLGTRVDVQQSARGRGRITIHFTSDAEFDRLRALLTSADDLPQVNAG